MLLSAWGLLHPDRKTARQQKAPPVRRPGGARSGSKFSKCAVLNSSGHLRARMGCVEQVVGLLQLPSAGTRLSHDTADGRDRIQGRSGPRVHDEQPVKARNMVRAAMANRSRMKTQRLNPAVNAGRPHRGASEQYSGRLPGFGVVGRRCRICLGKHQAGARRLASRHRGFCCAISASVLQTG